MGQLLDLPHICVPEPDTHLNVSWHHSTENRVGLGGSQNGSRCMSVLSAVCSGRPGLQLHGDLWPDQEFSGIPYALLRPTNASAALLCGRERGRWRGSWQLVFLSEVITGSTAWAVFQLFGLLKSYGRAGQSLEMYVEYKIQKSGYLYVYFFYMNLRPPLM